MPTARSEIIYFLRSTVFVPESESATEFVSDRKKIRMTNVKETESAAIRAEIK